MKIGALLLTCEHGGNRVPREYAYLFTGAKAHSALASHRGYDLGVLPLARALARHFDTELLYSQITRLLVELNRSPGHPELFSEFSRRLDGAARKSVLDRYYTPHRERVLAAVESRCMNAGLVCHIGVHSFTPALGGERRNADIGLLYDPAHPYESAVCAAWQRALLQYDPTLRVRRNYPYRGNADGLTTTLRRRLPADRYLGIELETNQALLANAGPRRRRVVQAITASLRKTLQTRL